MRVARPPNLPRKWPTRSAVRSESQVEQSKTPRPMCSERSVCGAARGDRRVAKGSPVGRPTRPPSRDFYDHDPPLWIILVRAGPWPWFGLRYRELDEGLLLAASFLFLTPLDVLDDDRRQHGVL